MLFIVGVAFSLTPCCFFFMLCPVVFPLFVFLLFWCILSGTVVPLFGKMELVTFSFLDLYCHQSVFALPLGVIGRLFVSGYGSSWASTLFLF